MSISAIIIDDEFNARNNLKLLIEDFCPDVDVVAEAESADQARSLIEEHHPDLLFLDINMPNEDGFELLESLPERDFSVIFITAHNQFALKALKAGAIDYLEKPIDVEELQEAVQKIVDSSAKVGDINVDSVKSILQQFKNDSNSDTIAVPTLTGYEIIKISDIVRLEADESYTKLFLTDGSKSVSSMTIAKYERVLNPSVFFRVHKSHIINKRDHLKEFNRHDGNVAIMDNGSTIPVSRRKLTDFINAIKTF